MGKEGELKEGRCSQQISHKNCCFSKLFPQIFLKTFMLWKCKHLFTYCQEICLRFGWPSLVAMWLCTCWWLPASTTEPIRQGGTRRKQMVGCENIVALLIQKAYHLIVAGEATDSRLGFSLSKHSILTLIIYFVFFFLLSFPNFEKNYKKVAW